MLLFQAPLSFATRLSYRIRGFSRRGLVSTLARLSLMALTASMSSGCLIEDPPPYTQPGKTPPRLEQQGATPPIDQVMVYKRGDPIEFKIPVTSEDAGDPLQGVLLLDYSGGLEADLVAFGQVPASTLADVNPRFLTLRWTVRPGLTPGCHRFTLRVSHLSNFNNEMASHVVFDTKDVAEAYWWANLDPEDSSTLVNCPMASTGGT